MLEVGGKACIITPDGVLENPSYKKFRQEILEKCEIYAIVSLPKFAFAPYTKEKTYALFIKKRSDKVTKIQDKPIWMYIIDNDGLANSDKRFPTKLRNNRNGWMHDEISGWVSTDGIEMPGVLETRWLKYDDLDSGGTNWINDKGIPECQRKGGNIPIERITHNEYCTLLPEYYIRPYEPSYLDKTELIAELNNMHTLLPKINLAQLVKDIEKSSLTYTRYQAKAVPISKVIDKMSGNSGLTEEFIYHSMQNKGEKYAVLSSATEDRTKMGEIPMCTINNKPLKVFEGQEGLLVTRNGKAGHTRYLPSGRYTINDHAYILFVKKDAPYAIDLRWLAIQYRTEFLQFASNSDNGTWNMTGFFKQVKIDIPDIEEQKFLVDIYDKLTYVQSILSNLDFSVSKLFDKQVIVEDI